MYNGRPLFPGTSDGDQLDQIFRHLGTPDEADFPALVELPDYKVRFASPRRTAGRPETRACAPHEISQPPVHALLLTPARHPYPQPASYKRYPRPDSLAHLVPGLPAEGLDLLTRMLQHDPAKRISAADALSHPFFASGLPEGLRSGGLMGAPPPPQS
jgi:cyclin-dependent kinase